MENVLQPNDDSSNNLETESQTSPVEPIVAPILPQKSNRAKFPLQFLIGICVVVVGFYGKMQIDKSAEKQTSNSQPIVIQPTTTPIQTTTKAVATPAPTPALPQVKPGTLTSINETQNVYGNEQYGFRLTLPKNFYATQEGMWRNEADKSAQFFVDLSTYKPEDTPQMEFPGIRIVVSDFSGDFQKYVKEYAENNLRGYDPTNPPEITEKTIGGKLGYQIVSDYLVVNNGTLYSINNGIDDNLFNQIISTFKFITNNIHP